jgi:hypothetical protein
MRQMRAGVFGALLIVSGCHHSSLGVGSPSDGGPAAAAPADSGPDVAIAAPIDSGPEATPPPPDAAPARPDAGSLFCPGRGCTVEESRAYTDCVLDRCDLPYQACLGARYRSNDFGGPCGLYVTCYASCPCGDDACRAACGTPSSACQTCLLNQAVPCVQQAGCPTPICRGVDAGSDARLDASSDAGAAGCADLMKCCASATNLSIKMACDAQVAALKDLQGSDQSCAQLASQYRMAGLCTF